MNIALAISLLVLLNIILGVSGRTSVDRIRDAGYASETHDVVTKDGYILTIFRVKNSTNSVNGAQRSAPILLIMHGLTSSSDCWVIAKQEACLPFNSVDSGYDVWLANARGTPYGSRHTSMTVNDRSFWRFSWDEIGTIDLPATIDYILKETGQSSLHYIGHSQGTTVLFVLLSTQPEYNQKLKSTHMLAPVSFMTHVRSPLIRLEAQFLGNYTPIDPIIGDTPILQQPILRHLAGFDTCSSPASDSEYCASLLFLVYGGYSRYLNKTLLPEIFSTHPASASTHQGLHYGQLCRSGRFRPYDFGVQGNLERYNRTTPPDYEVMNINPRFPLHFYYSAGDELTSYIDVERLMSILGNRTVKHFIDLPQYAHIDYGWSSNAYDVINKGIIKEMNAVEMILQQEDGSR